MGWEWIFSQWQTLHIYQKNGPWYANITELGHQTLWIWVSESRKHSFNTYSLCVLYLICILIPHPFATVQVHGYYLTMETPSDLFPVVLINRKTHKKKTTHICFVRKQNQFWLTAPSAAENYQTLWVTAQGLHSAEKKNCSAFAYKVYFNKHITLLLMRRGNYILS